MNLKSMTRNSISAALVALVLVGCAAVPTQELSDARQAIQAAEAADARTYALQRYNAASGELASAEQSVEAGSYSAAKEQAIAAKTLALSARNIALALSRADKAIAEARSLGALWRDTEALYAQAQQAADAGDESQAVLLAGKAEQQARAATNQHYLELARGYLREAEAFPLTAADQADRDHINALIAAHDGRAAHDGALKLLRALQSRRDNLKNYDVVRGDSLWDIAARSIIYQNAYQWPLIFKANRDQIKDPDLIFPGQRFDIPRDYSDAERDAAIDHARNRGAWKLGDIEASDRRYLGDFLMIR